MTLREYLRGLTNYPVSEEALDSILARRGGEIFTPGDDGTKQSLLAMADLYSWLSTAPDVSQGGQSYSLTDEIRRHYRRKANAYYRLCGEHESVTQETATFGYKGERL